MIEFVVPIKVTGKLGLNSLYSTNKHWSKRKSEAEKIHLAVKGALLSCKIPRQLFNNPVAVEFFYNSRIDIDNHGYISKLLIDGMKGYLLADDNQKYVQKLTQSYWNGEGVKVEISEIVI